MYDSYPDFSTAFCSYLDFTNETKITKHEDNDDYQRFERNST